MTNDARGWSLVAAVWLAVCADSAAIAIAAWRGGVATGTGMLLQALARSVANRTTREWMMRSNRPAAVLVATRARERLLAISIVVT